MKRLDKKNIEDILALTPMQEGMLFHYLKDPGSDKNFEQLYLEISGKMDIKRFRKAWNFVIDTNEMLRTVFWWERVTRPIQLVLKKHSLDLRYFDISENGRSKNETDKLIEDIKSKEREKKLDLFDVPFRVTLCKIAKDKYGIIISHHHILYDGWSNSIILREFFNAYEILSHQKTPMKPVKGKFKEFIMWIQIQDKEAQKKFWKEYLEGFEMKSGHPVKKKEEVKRTAVYRFQFQDETRDKIYCFVKEYKISVSSLLYSAWGILLQKYNGCEDVLFDTTVSGRSAKVKGIENMVGLFINTLPVRVKALSNEKLIDVLYQMKDRQQGWEAFENTSPAIIKEHLDECRRDVLFDSVVVIENYPVNIKSIQEDSEFSIDSFSNVGMTHYDLTVLIAISDSINIEFIYNKDLFDEEIAAMVTHHFVSIVNEIVSHPWERVSGIPISAKEIKKIFHPFSTKQATVRERKGEDEAAAYEYAAPVDEVEEKLVDIWSEVLKVEKGRIGVHSDFFDFGGHSLKASLLAAKLHKEFNVKISLAEVFKYSTIRELSRYIKEKEASGEMYFPLKTADEKQYYASSSVQKRMYALQQLDLESMAYNVSSAMMVEGHLDKERLEDVFKKLINRHESFRTSFEVIDGEPVQKIHKKVKFIVEDYIPVGAGEQGGLAPLREGALSPPDIIKHFIRPFDLTQAPLLRVGLYRLPGLGMEDEKHLLVLDMHHIITDGVSMDIFIKEFTALYKGEECPELRYQYKDFSEWQKNRLKSGNLKQQEKHWLEEFSGELPVLNTLTDFSRPSIQNFEGDRLSFSLEEELIRQINKLAKETSTTLFMVFLAALNVLLSRYSGQEDIVIGTTVAGRGHIDLQNIVGLFIETLALRNFPRGNKIFKEFLREVRENTLSAYENESYPFRELMKQVGEANDVSRNPLFNVMLIVQNIDIATLKIEGLTLIPVEFFSMVSKVDFTLEVFENAASTRFDLEYCTKLYRRETMERLAGHFINILREVVNHPKVPLSEIEILSNEERRQILEDFKNSKRGYSYSDKMNPEDTGILNLFEKQVEQGPGSIAVVYEGEQLTYKELNEKANVLSKVIREL
jgi:non-ribosomal peptide synthetase component F/acyl carrier protein